jgi:hypothetical protein
MKASVPKAFAAAFGLWGARRGRASTGTQVGVEHRQAVRRRGKNALSDTSRTPTFIYRAGWDDLAVWAPFSAFFGLRRSRRRKACRCSTPT